MAQLHIIVCDGCNSEIEPGAEMVLVAVSVAMGQHRNGYTPRPSSMTMKRKLHFHAADCPNEISGIRDMMDQAADRPVRRPARAV